MSGFHFKLDILYKKYVICEILFEKSIKIIMIMSQ